MFTMNPEHKELVEEVNEDPDRRFSPEFEAMLERYKKNKGL